MTTDEPRRDRSARVAVDLPDIRLADYQRAARLLLRHPLVTADHPDGDALVLVRRFEDHLRADFEHLTRYQLEVSTRVARLVKRPLDVDHRYPARSHSDRPFDRRRYCYLCLVLADLGRAGPQTIVTQLAENLGRAAAELDGLGFDPDHWSERLAFIDVLRWLEDHRILVAGEGSATDWSRDQGHDALYDIDHDAAFRLFQPPSILQRLEDTGELLDERYATGREGRRRRARHRVTRLLLERPVVLLSDLSGDERDYLVREAGSIAEDVERFCGRPVERRAEGLALCDPSSRWTDIAFPSGGTVTQVALLLCEHLAASVPATLPSPHPPRHARLERLESARPGAVESTAASDPAETGAPAETGEMVAVVTGDQLRVEVGRLADRYARTFAARYRDDLDLLTREVADLLESLDLLRPCGANRWVPTPVIARYAAEEPEATQLSLVGDR